MSSYARISLFVLGLLLVPLLFQGCLDEIDLPAPREVRDAVVLEGSLRDGDPAIASVTVSRLFDFTANFSRPVIVREITLLDDADNAIELSEVSPGTYEVRIPKNSSTFPVEVGKSYQLRVVTFDGQELLSRPEPLLSVADAGSMSVLQIQKEVTDRIGNFVNEDYLSFNIDVPIQNSSDGQSGRYLWTLEQTWKLTDTPLSSQTPAKTCYITETVDVTQLTIFDGNDFSGNQGAFVTLYERPTDFVFAEGYYLTAYQQSLSETAYRYWSEVTQVAERTGNLFEPPPGKIRTNFEKINDNGEGNEVFGFFYATQVDTARIYVAPDFAGNPTALCPWPPGKMASPGSLCPLVPCCDCLVADRSQLDPPDFWIE